MPITTDLDRFRLLLGDHPTVDVPEGEYVYLLNDDEAEWFIAEASSVLLAVADACDSLAARFAQEVDETEDGQSFRNSQRAAMYAAMAARFRKRATDETAAAQTGAGLPIGRVPSRVPTSWAERY